MAFSDIWQVNSDNEDLEGFAELQLDCTPNVNDEGHGHEHVHSRDDLRRSKRNLMLGLVGFIAIMAWLIVTIARSRSRV